MKDIKWFLKLTETANNTACFVDINEVIAFGQFYQGGTTIVLKNESRDILVKETTEEIQERIDAAIRKLSK